MELIIAIGLPLVLFMGGLLLSEYAYQAGETMDARRAIVFEVYRYAMCFIMVLLFGIMAFQMISALIVDAANTQALAAPGVGVILTGGIFLAHWFMKNPLAPKSQANTTPTTTEA